VEAIMAGFLILVDAPSPGDPDKQLMDSYGRYFWHLLLSARVPTNDLKIEFIYNSYYEMEMKASRIREVMARHPEVRVILALGSNVIKALGIEGNLGKVRGSVFKYRGADVIPTYHPSELRDKGRIYAEESVTKAYYTSGDIAKAIRVWKGKYSRPEERFIVEPTLNDVRKFHKMWKEKNPLLGCDLEGTGLSIEHSLIFVHGFAWSESDAICIPELTEGMKKYWSPIEWKEVQSVLQDIYKNGRLMFQNGVGYDVPLLRARGWDVPLEQFEVDTMVLHHTLNPELPHNIGFISSVYGKQPYWKNEFLIKKVNIEDMEQIGMRTYNCRDCVALYQIYNGMNEELDDLQQNPVYHKIPELIEKSMKLSRIVIKMFEHGIMQDQRNMKAWQKYILKEQDRLKADFYKEFNLPPNFSLNSSAHKMRLVYGNLPDSLSYEKIEAELELYDTPSYNYQYECTECGRKITKKFYDNEERHNKKRLKCPKCKKVQLCFRTEKERTSLKGKDKNTDTYRALRDKLAIKNIEPFYQLHRYVPLRSKKSNQDALDKGALARYIVHIDERVSAINSMKRRLPKHDVERENLLRTRQGIVMLQEVGIFTKMVSNYYNIPVWRDGMVRPFALVTGTATGRWSYKNPAIQTMPHGEMGKKVRSTFRARPGHTLLSVDFGNLEVHIGARFMGDEVLITMLEEGLNLHDENTRIFFGLKKGDEGFEAHRGVAKMIQFAAIFYGGGDRSIFSKAKTAEPDCSMTFKHFTTALQNYRIEHPAYPIFVEKVQKLASDERISINAFGRVRTLLSEENAIGRQALNTPIQGSAADAVGEDMILLDEAFDKLNLKSTMLLQVHDEILFEIPDDELSVACPIIKDVMNREREINGYKFRIPIDAEAGTHWGLQKPFDLETQTYLEGGSKH
jgi:DNA polymerase I-like protein with 3'-5' exonuclease and polymerase domains/DNA-directed RNA polymerase subunit RPC12/RpoP